jgi:hypothetical protein
MGELVAADPDFPKFSFLIQNLLSTAVKFPKHPHVSVSYDSQVMWSNGYLTDALAEVYNFKFIK